MTFCMFACNVRTYRTLLYGLPALVWRQYTIVNHTKCRQSHVGCSETVDVVLLCSRSTTKYRWQFHQYTTRWSRDTISRLCPKRLPVTWFIHLSKLTCTCNEQYPLVVNKKPAVGLSTLLLLPEISELYVQYIRNQNMTICMLHVMFVRTVHSCTVFRHLCDHNTQ